MKITEIAQLKICIGNITNMMPSYKREDFNLDLFMENVSLLLDHVDVLMSDNNDLRKSIEHKHNTIVELNKKLNKLKYNKPINTITVRGGVGSIGGSISDLSKTDKCYIKGVGAAGEPGVPPTPVMNVSFKEFNDVGIKITGAPDLLNNDLLNEVKSKCADLTNIVHYLSKFQSYLQDYVNDALKKHTIRRSDGDGN